MDNLVEWEIPVDYIAGALARGFLGFRDAETHYLEIYETDAFIITTYFTSVWLHAHEHIADVEPGTFPNRLYAGEKMLVTLGDYEIELNFNAYDIDADNDWYNQQWEANILNKANYDTLLLVVQSDYDYEPGFVTSQINIRNASALVRDIVDACKQEFSISEPQMNCDSMEVCHG